MKPRAAVLVLGAALTASPAWAQARDYCPERPGLNTPPCIVDKGHASLEISLADWTLDDQPDSHTDAVLIGDAKLRIGMTDTIEAQIGWTPYGHLRTRERQSAGAAMGDGIGMIAQIAHHRAGIVVADVGRKAGLDGARERFQIGQPSAQGRIFTPELFTLLKQFGI